MLIDTKFNLGDKVWFISRDGDNWAWITGKDNHFIIKRMEVFINPEDHVATYLWGNIKGHKSEYVKILQTCFSTYREAKKECTKRNKEDKKRNNTVCR